MKKTIHIHEGFILQIIHVDDVHNFEIIYID